MSGIQSMRPSLGCTMRLQTSTGASALAQTPLAGGRVAAFSTTAHMRKRKTKDNNKQRGVSSLYRSGPREPLSMSKVPLPKPRAQYKPTVETNEKHGLWGFFPEPKKLMYTPKEMEEHGRAWTIEELRRKSWEDLHALWWTCCKERNMLFTSMAELKRANLGFGKQELDNRVDELQKTMKAIKHTLTERYYTWEDAAQVAQEDPEIDLQAEDGQIYKPSAYEEEHDVPDAWATEPAQSKTEPAKVPV